MALLKVKYVGNKFWQFNCIYGLQTVGSLLVRTFKLKFGMSLHLQQLLIQMCYQMQGTDWCLKRPL